jgi:4-amino-4-deoxy-L-arabinose transferase-like glycosyltransferase
MLLVGLLPWTVLLPSTGMALWRERRRIDRRDARLFSLIWIVAVFAPYAVATSKRGVYLLPLYPAVSLLLGWWASQVVRGALAPRWLARPLVPLAWVLAALLGMLAGVALAQAVGLPLLDAAAQLFDPRTARDLGLVAADGPRLCLRLAAALAVGAAAAAGLACAMSLRRWGMAMAAMFVCTAAMTVAVRGLVLPALAKGETRRPLAAALRRVVGAPAEVHTGPNLDYGLIYYWGAPIPVYNPRRGGAPPPYLLVPDGAWRRMSPAERRHYHRVPALTIEHGRKQGYPILLQRIDEPPGRTAD